jgi:aspartokinase/homoserine dehydrogenase 1
MKILKFGGSSQATAERVRNVVEIIEAAIAEGPIAVVVSALGGVTDDLIAASDTAAGGDRYDESITAIKDRHHTAADELTSSDEVEQVVTFFDEVFKELDKVLHGASLVGECTPRTLDAVLSCGERLSAQL